MKTPRSRGRDTTDRRPAPPEGAAAGSDSPAVWHFVTPQLPVSDVRETQAYYRDVLGFRIAWIWREEYGAVYNGRTEIFFARADGPIHPASQFVRVEDADAVLAAYRARGVKVVEEIQSHPWGMREFTIEDNNGHRFRIGHSQCGVESPSADEARSRALAGARGPSGSHESEGRSGSGLAGDGGGDRDATRDPLNERSLR